MLLGVDPTTLPDVKPFVADEPDLLPTAAQILGTSDDGATDPEPAATPATGDEGHAGAGPSEPGQGSSLPLVLGVGGAVVVGAAAALLIGRSRKDAR